MSWSSWQAFADMGGHARFVWGSFGVVALTLLIEWVQLRRDAARLEGSLRQRWLEEAAEAQGAHDARYGREVRA